MADFAYTYGLLKIALGDVHWDSDDIRFILCMNTTTATAEGSTGRDATFISGITLDEMDGDSDGLARPPVFASRDQLTIVTNQVTADVSNNRAEIDANNFTISSLLAGTRAIQGIIVYFHVTNDAASVPLLWIDSGGFPFTANGGDLVLSWNAEGIGQITSAG